MFISLIKYLIVFLCGYLFLAWLPVPNPFVLSDFFISIIINPLQFFAASLALFIGVLLNGGLIKGIMYKTGKIREKQLRSRLPILMEYLGVGLVFYLLFHFGWKQTILFFSLSFLYGMISIDH